MQALDWTDLQTFLAVARAGQLARASTAMKLDATTLGRRLRKLEARLGTTLFEQTREGQVLTESGEMLLAKVEAMDLAAAQIADAGERGGGLAGTLRLSVSEGFGTWFVARRLGEFSVHHPHLTIDLVASSGFLSPSKREADVAVVMARPRAGPLIASKLSDYALQLYASADYLERCGMPASPAELAEGHILVGYVPDLVYAPELRYLDEVHPGLVASIRSSSIVAQRRLISEGAGIGVLPCFMADRTAGLLPVLPQVRIERSFWLVTHKDNHGLARVRACRDWLTAIVQEDRARLLP